MGHCSHKGKDMVSNNTQVDCGVQTMLNWYYTKCAKKISPPHHYTTTTSLNRWDKAGWIHAFMFFTPNSDSIIWMLQQKSRLIRQATFFQSSIVQFWWAGVNCILRVLFLSDRSGTRCGLLLLEPICFRVQRVVCSEMVFCRPWL